MPAPYYFIITQYKFSNFDDLRALRCELHLFNRLCTQRILGINE